MQRIHLRDFFLTYSFLLSDVRREDLDQTVNIGVRTAPVDLAMAKKQDVNVILEKLEFYVIRVGLKI